MTDFEAELSNPGFYAMQALLVFAVDPVGCGGLHLCGLPGPGRDAVLRAVARAQQEGAPYVRIPCHVSDDRLLGGLDLASTLAAGKPVVAQGLLASADTGAAIFVMAERLARRTVANIVNTMDSHHIQLERDGFSASVPARFTSIVMDESLGDDEFLNPAFADRLAFRIWTDELAAADVDSLPISPHDLRHARESLRDVEISDRVITAICNTALGLGVASLRSALLCVHSARALAALSGDRNVDDEHAAAAVQLVLAHRAMQLPPIVEEGVEEGVEDAEDDTASDQNASDNHSIDDSGSDQQQDAANQTDPEDDNNRQEKDTSEASTLDDVLIEAATAALPQGLLEALSRDPSRRRQTAQAGRAGAKARAMQRGRPVGDMRPSDGSARLNVLATIKAAAPWQKLRNAQSGRVEVRRDDFRVTRRKIKTQTTNIFVVDASGSSAAQRLGEVKGAVELLLADCYVRRDQVALIGFRGSSAELLLSPTRSLVRAKRELASLAGGGATPLAIAIDAACSMARSVEQQGQRPVVILLTDGRGNVGRDGTPGHADCKAHTDDAAKAMAGAGIQTLLVDVSRRPRERGRELARHLGGRYLALPFANAQSLSQAVKTANAVTN